MQLCTRAHGGGAGVINSMEVLAPISFHLERVGDLDKTKWKRESLRGELSFASSISAFLAIRTFRPGFVYNPSLAVSRAEDKRRRRLFRSVRRVPLQGTRYSRLRGERNALWFSSRRWPLSSLDRPLHFPSFHVERSLLEFLANARDRWKQLFQPTGITTVQSRRVITFKRFLDHLGGFAYLAAFRETVRSERSIGDRFAAISSRVSTSDRFLTRRANEWRKNYFFEFTFVVWSLRDKVECIKSNSSRPWIKSLHAWTITLSILRNIIFLFEENTSTWYDIKEKIE